MPGAPDQIGDHHGAHSSQPPNASIALQMVSTFAANGVVGVMELFDESLCLVKYKLSGDLPPSCACDAPPSTDPSLNVHNNRGVPAHSLGDLRNSTLALVDEITQVDAQVYVTALGVVLAELAELSLRLKVQLLCEGRLDTVRAALGYMPQAVALLDKMTTVEAAV